MVSILSRTKEYIFPNLKSYILRKKLDLYYLCYVAISDIGTHNSRKESSNKKFDVSNLEILSKESPCLVLNKHIHLNTVGSGAIGAARCLYVETLNRSFIFNCGENVIRIANEHKVKIGHVSEVFFTSDSWRNLLGIPIFHSYTSINQGKSFLTYGPPNLAPVLNEMAKLDASNYLSPMRHIGVKEDVFEFEESLKIKTVPIYSSNPLLHDHPAIAYICTAPAVSGPITIHKLLDADVPPGPMVDQLKKGLAITLPDGTIVTPDNVRDHYPAKTFIVIEIPSVDHLESLVSCKTFSPHQADCCTSDEDVPLVIVHFSPSHVMKDARYQAWANSFSPSVSHLVLNDNNTCLGLSYTISLQIQLNQLLPKVFPLLHDSSIPSVEHREENPNSQDLLNPHTLTEQYGFIGPTVQSKTALHYYVRPPKAFNSAKCPVVFPNEIIDSFYDEEDVEVAFTQMQKKFAQLRASQAAGKVLRPYPRVLFLGTGAASSSPSRAPSGILVQTEPESCFLLDCGEGTFSQLVRFVGIEETENLLQRLKLIFVSHDHRDHHLGLVGLLQQRQEIFRKAGKKLPPLFLLLPTKVKLYLLSIDRCYIPILKDVFIINNVNLLRNAQFHPRDHSRICNLFSMDSINVQFAKHIKNSFCISLTHSDGWKLTYSGDTMPCTTLRNIGMNSDLLIHEATLQDELEEEAEKKRHSTVSQAIQAGVDMKAKFTILTHFSHRYHRIPVLTNGCPENVGIAFDNMVVTLDDLPFLPHLYPVLKERFCRDLDKYESKIYRMKHFD